MSTDDQSAPLYWGPAGPPADKRLVDSWSAGRSDADAWGPYHDVLFPPRRTTPWISFKIASTGVSVAKRLWAEREDRRREYEAIHGSAPEHWPTRHPAVVLESVQWMAHAACLGCHWLNRDGTYTKLDGWRSVAAEQTLRHEESAI